MKRHLKSVLVAGIASVGLTAEAAYFVDIQQFGDDVVAIGSGSINYDALTFEGLGFVGGPRIQANEARLFLTPLANSTVQLFSGISGPDNFGIGSVVTTGLTFSTIPDNPVVINGSLGLLALPDGYPSGDFLEFNQVIWDNVFFEDLDIVEGTYVWQWGSGETFDTFTIRIGSGISPPPDTDPPTNNVPEPSTLILLGAALLGLRFFPPSSREKLI